MDLTTIQKFYKDKVVFITGGTGFLGKATIEKLLRSCSDVNKIIVPLRPKPNKSLEERINEYFSEKLFEETKNKNPQVMNKVLFLKSNLEEYHFGLSDEDYKKVMNSVNIIFHCAASVEFFASLKIAVNSNIKITQNIMTLAQDSTNIQAVVYVSTMWSHSAMNFSEEKVYDLAYKPEVLYSLVNNLDKKKLKEFVPTLLKNWPNTYTMTKNVAENIIQTQEENLPVAIIRPAIVSASYKEPSAGWFNNLQSASILVSNVARGITRIIYADGDRNAHIVPVDYVLNCMLAIAWHTAMQDRFTKKLQVYNYTTVSNPVSRNKVFNTFVNTKYPLKDIISTPGYITTQSKIIFETYYYLFQILPAYVYDLCLQLIGKKPRYTEIMIRNKIALKAVKYFLTTNFQIEYSNVPKLWNALDARDKELFDFNLDTIDWEEYLDVYCKGVKEFLDENLMS